jgi:hypothetical protein
MPKVLEVEGVEVVRLQRVDLIGLQEGHDIRVRR